jgi:hypothetical protein
MAACCGHYASFLFLFIQESAGESIFSSHTDHFIKPWEKRFMSTLKVKCYLPITAQDYSQQYTLSVKGG